MVDKKEQEKVKKELVKTEIISRNEVDGTEDIKEYYSDGTSQGFRRIYLDGGRKAKDKLEKERVEKDKLEKERVEKEKIDKENSSNRLSPITVAESNKKKEEENKKKEEENKKKEEEKKKKEEEKKKKAEENKVEEDVPKIETPKEGPKIDTPKEILNDEIPIPKEILNDEIPKDIQNQNKINKQEEIKHMAEEDEELIQERKFEKWMKKNKFNENVEKTAKITEDNQGQIKNISEGITGVKGGLEGLNSRLGDTKKPIAETLGELCNGVDCIEKDVKKYQDTQIELEKKIDTNFGELKERIQKLEEPTFTCTECGYTGIRPMSSFCSNCGFPIHSWNGPDDKPVDPNWKPYPMRVAKK